MSKGKVKSAAIPMINKKPSVSASAMDRPATGSQGSSGMVSRHNRRVIVIGDNANNAAALFTGREVTVVPSFYHAIGDLVVTDLNRAPDAIMCSLSAIGSGSAVELVAAVRRIDPSVCLMVVADPENEHLAVDAVEDGFDTYVLNPVTRLELERAINQAGQLATQHSQQRPTLQDKDNNSNIDNSMSTVPPVDEQGETGPKAELKLTLADDYANNEIFAENEILSANTDENIIVETVIKPDITPLQFEQSNKTDTSKANMSNTTSIDIDDQMTIAGDIDLIEKLIDNKTPQLKKLALDIITVQTGIRDLGISDEPENAGGLSIAIKYKGHKPIAYLNCMDVHMANILKPWADWLGYWLTLQRQMTNLREMAFTDKLTGAWNRRYFDKFLDLAIKDSRNNRTYITLMVFDIDNFKLYNDKYGHSAGDEILIEMVRLLKSVIRPQDKVCRLGGDEFAVIFYDQQNRNQRETGSTHPSDIYKIARRFQEQIRNHRFPKLFDQAPGTLTISGGLATYPWDGADAQALVEHADQSALAAKRAGKNAISLGPQINS